MKHFSKWLILGLSVFLANQTAQAFEIGEIPPKVELKEKLGGRLDGKPWSSEELQGKVHVLFYVDPDEKDTNNPASEALDKEKFPPDKFQSIGMINMAATWMPNVPLIPLWKKSRNDTPRPFMCGTTRRHWSRPGK